MPRPAWLVVLLAAFLVAPHAGAQDGRLQRLRDEVRAEEPGAPSTGGARGDRCDDEDPLLGELFGALFGEVIGVVFVHVLGAPFVGPAYVLGDTWKHSLYLPPHPYPAAYPGYLLLAPGDAYAYGENLSTDVPRQSWGGRVSVENGNDFSGLNRVGARLHLDTTCRIGLVTDWNYFHERLGDGRTDQTVIGDVNLTLRFAQNEVASMYAGLGFRTLADRDRSDFGINFTYGGDWFPARPLVVSGAVDAGTLGGAGVFRGRATAGAVFNGWEVFAGYDYLRIGDVRLHGPLVGVRLWF